METTHDPVSRDCHIHIGPKPSYPASNELQFEDAVYQINMQPPSCPWPVPSILMTYYSIARIRGVLPALSGFPNDMAVHQPWLARTVLVRSTPGRLLKVGPKSTHHNLEIAFSSLAYVELYNVRHQAKLFTSMII